MRALLLVTLTLLSLPTVHAGQNLILGKVLFDAGAPMMSDADLRSFLRSGVQLETYAPRTGSVRYWTNEASGKFIASRQGGTGNARSNGSGEWKITDGGQYCVVIEWRTAKGGRDNVENWCRVVYQHDGETYLAPRDLAANLDKQYTVVRVK